MRLSSRARFVLDGMRNPNKVSWSYSNITNYWRDYSPDGEWFCLERVLNVGRVTIAELLDARLIERKGEGNLGILYRLITEQDDDFGDLWVA
jgi:hypothetical protein